MAVQRLNALVDNKKKILNSFSIIQKVANHYQSRLWTVFSKSLLCSVIPDDDRSHCWLVLVFLQQCKSTPQAGSLWQAAVAG